MKHSIILLFTLLFGFKSLVADEGMWMPNLIKTLNEKDMQEKGLQLSADEIYNINNSSLKDAIVALNGGGCTAEMISAEGLMLTNHHCVDDLVQSHSTVENNYLKNGFWAMSKTEELKNEGVTATFLVSIEDVTNLFKDSLSSDLSESERNQMISKILRSLFLFYGIKDTKLVTLLDQFQILKK